MTGKEEEKKSDAVEPKEEVKHEPEEEDVTDRLSTLETKVDDIAVSLSEIKGHVTPHTKEENDTQVSEHAKAEPSSPDVKVEAPTEYRYIRKGRRIVKREVPVKTKKAGE